ncbi:MAG: TonB-dependent receptor [Candidatus Omnitrophica bacterium]|nr:TonB-dependent receptor [Candidatus Omnitrophota bacterium]
MRVKIDFLLVFLSLFICNCFADEVALERIVVTPSRTQENIKGTTSAVTVYTRSDIENAKADSAKEFLKGTVGLDIVQTGSYGSPVSVFLRGTNSGHLQVMIDNVRVYDPIATNASFNFANLTLDNIERVEVVRGPQSVLYGSDAIGGAINIITKKGKGEPVANILLQGGSYDSHKEYLDSSGRLGNLAYAFTLSHFESLGISKFKGTSERDPYQNNSASLRLDYDLNSENSVGFTSRFTEGIYEYDNSVGLKDDPDMQAEQEQFLISQYFENKISDVWQQRLQFSFMRNYRQDSNDKDPAYPDDYLRNWYIGENQQLDWQHTLRISDFDTVVAGFDWQREKGNYYYYTEYSFGSSQTHFPKAISRTKGCYLENMFNLDDIFRLNTGLRIDDHSSAGTHETYKFDTSYLFNSGTKIKGGWGTAYKAPTLYQLHALPDPWFGGGNVDLKPEESQTYEAGFEQNLFQDRIQLSSVYFHTQIKNLIDAKYNAATWFTDAYSNIGKARIFGYETTLTFKPYKGMGFDLGYTWQDTEDKSNGDELLRRPKNKYFAIFNYAPNGKIDFGIKAMRSGHRNDSSNRLMKAYTRVDLTSNYKLNSSAEAFLKIENLTDEIYEEVKNYAQPGRSYTIGLKASF